MRIYIYIYIIRGSIAPLHTKYSSKTLDVCTNIYIYIYICIYIYIYVLYSHIYIYENRIPTYSDNEVSFGRSLARVGRWGRRTTAIFRIVILYHITILHILYYQII